MPHSTLLLLLADGRVGVAACAPAEVDDVTCRAQVQKEESNLNGKGVRSEP